MELMASRNTDSSKRSVVATTLPFQATPDFNSDKLIATLIDQGTISWTARYLLIRRLGIGGQGIVYLADRVGADGWEVPVAVKFFSRERYADMRAYEEDMSRIAQISARVAVIQQDHLLDVHNFVELQGIRAMSMEWVDGFDLDFLLARDRLTQLELDLNLGVW